MASPHRPRAAGGGNVRIHALDGLRATIMILGVFLHASVAYMHAPIPGLVWLTRTPSEGLVFDAIFWYLHGFRIPLFFLIAGFFTALLRELRGCDIYIRHRLRRIALPLVCAALTVLPVTYSIWGLGLVEQQSVAWREVARMSFLDDQLKEALLGLAHLWFLQYLLLYSIAYYLLCRTFPRLAVYRIKVRLLERRWRLFPVALLSGALLWAHPQIYLTFDNRWLPDPWGLVYYGLFFVLGTRLYRVRKLLHRLIPLGLPFVTGSLVVFAWILYMLPLWLDTAQEPLTSTNGWLAIGVTTYTWLAIWGFLGLFLRLYTRRSKLARFLADSAYWIYLVHLPLVGLTQLSVAYLEHRWTLNIPPGVGFTLTVSCTLAISLLSYRYLVRYGWIGYWLHGPKRKDQLP